MKKIILILIIISLLLSGCDFFKSATEKIPSNLPGLEEKQEQSVFGGRGSIQASMVNPQKQGTVLKSYAFQPVIRIENLGGSESQGQLCITGLDQDVFSGFSGCECQSYQQRRMDNSFEEQELRFGPYNIQLDQPKTYSLTAINRFSYSTEIKADVCITADIYEDRECSADINTVTSGPLKVSSIEETIIPISNDLVSLIFTMDIENVGDGTIRDLQKINERCVLSPADKKEKKIKAEITGFPVAADLQCQESSLDEDEETSITCEAKQVSLFDSRGNYLFGDDYKPEITFRLEYGYETRDSNTFNVE